jgi:hypothetical protein
VEEAVKIPWSVGVAKGLFVLTKEGVKVEEATAGGVGEKIWLATGLP